MANNFDNTNWFDVNTIVFILYTLFVAFFIYGTIYGEYENKLDAFYKKHLGKTLLLLLTILFVIGGWFFPRDYTFYFMQNSVYQNVGVIIYRYSLYFAATTSVLLGLKFMYLRLEKNFFISFFRWIGEHTLTIYAGHLLIIYYVVMPFRLTIMKAGFLAYYVVVPIISIIVMIVLAKVEELFASNKLFRKLFLGLR